LKGGRKGGAECGRLKGGRKGGAESGRLKGVEGKEVQSVDV